MSPSKKAYFDAQTQARNLGRSAKAILAMNTQALAQDIVDNISLAPEDYIPRHFEGGVTPELAKDVADLMVEDAKDRHQALVDLRAAIMSLPGHEYDGVIANLSRRILAVSRIMPSKEI